MAFKPLMKFSFWIFVANFFVLMKIGGLHPEYPFITVGLISTIIYFAWFLLVIPVFSFTESFFIVQPYTSLSKNGLVSVKPKPKLTIMPKFIKNINKDILNRRYYSSFAANKILDKEVQNNINNNSENMIIPAMIYDNMDLLKKTNL